MKTKEWNDFVERYVHSEEMATKLKVAFDAEIKKAIAEHEARQDTITVKALRKRGTDRWYEPRLNPHSGNIIYKEMKYPFNYHPSYIFDNNDRIPTDAELVEIECRVVKTVEP